MSNYDFCGWATKNDLKCSDGRIIRKGAFEHNDGEIVPLIWNHNYNDPYCVIGKVKLEHRDEGVYAYGYLNDTELGKTAKIYVEHGDITRMSIRANKLQHQGPNVMYGDIKDVSLVIAGANPGAFIENLISHGEEVEDEAWIHTGEDFFLYHSEEVEVKKGETEVAEETKKEEGKGKTVQEIWESMNEEQQELCAAMVGQVTLDDEEVEHSEGGEYSMKFNAFEGFEGGETGAKQGTWLTHSDEEAIVALAKQSSVGSLKTAMKIYAEEHGEELSHGLFNAEDTEALFPEYELLKKGEPETLERDQSWIAAAMSKIHKSPISRIRTRQADARIAALRAKGYQNKGDQKTNMAQIKLLGRTTDPQTIYIKDDMHRDDVIDITDFDVVAYQWKMMRHVLNEELVLAALIGDGRDDGDPDKIHEDHIRSIWNDEELYTIHKDVDIAAARTELQGTNTGANFGENYIYAEAIITAALYAREQYKGSGTPDLYCTPHLLNVMLLARDLNGRRIYDSKADLAAALNVDTIHTAEQFEGRTRTTKEGTKKKLLGLFVNLDDYQFGATKGGEVTKFDDFDMDFNKMKFMLETRLSGALRKVYSAIALEEPVVGE